MARRKGSRNRFNSNRDIVAMKQRRQDKRAADRGEDRDGTWDGDAAYTRVWPAGRSAGIPVPERHRAR